MLALQGIESVGMKLGRDLAGLVVGWIINILYDIQSCIITRRVSLTSKRLLANTQLQVDELGQLETR